MNQQMFGNLQTTVQIFIQFKILIPLLAQKQQTILPKVQQIYIIQMKKHKMQLQRQ